MDRDELARKAAILKNPNQTERARQAVAAVESELRSESAASLGRAGTKIAAALAALEAPELTPEAFNALREKALRAKWELRVQRDALGLLRHDDLDRLYPVPPRRR